MALVNLTGTIDADTLNSNFSDELGVGNIALGQVGSRHDEVRLYVDNLSTTEKAVTFEPLTAFDLKELIIQTDDSGGHSATVTAALQQADGGDTYLLRETWSASLVGDGATVTQRVFEDFSGLPALLLSRGVRYKLCVVATGAVERVAVCLILQARRRRT